MVYNPGMMRDEDEEQTTGTGVQTSSGSGVIGAGGSAGGSAPGAVSGSRPQTSTGFVNIQRYLDANKGGADAMKNKIVQGSKEADGYFDYQMKDVNYYAKKPDMGQYGAINSPVQFKDGKWGYGGPTSLEDSSSYKKALNAATTYQDRYGNIGTNVGRQQELQRQYGNGSYTRGMMGLDNAITGADAATRQALTKLQENSGRYMDRLGDSKETFDGHLQKTMDWVEQTNADREAAAKAKIEENAKAAAKAKLNGPDLELAAATKANAASIAKDRELKKTNDQTTAGNMQGVAPVAGVSQVDLNPVVLPGEMSSVGLPGDDIDNTLTTIGPWFRA